MFLLGKQAYKRETSSVRIAKIIGLTVIASSIILGAFILASTYMQARVSCDQMQTLDSILEKELMLETLQQVSHGAAAAHHSLSVTRFTLFHAARKPCSDFTVRIDSVCDRSPRHDGGPLLGFAE